jgi:phenylacetate-coenzyme A ligase PaaK-like adenylate-forming protein
MPIIGKLIQRSTAISFKRISRKSPDYKQQLEALRQNIEVAKKTKFGLTHHFTSLLQRTDLVSRYQQQVPITEYDTFYQDWLEDAIIGAKDHIWPGRIKYFALSSGTTGAPSKRIPVTTEMIRSFQRVSLRQFSVLHELNLSDTFYGSKVLAVGGSTKLKKVGNHFEGDLSGILKKHTSLIAAPFAKPNKKITHLKDWKAKLPLMVEQAPKWNIGIMAGIPSWCVLLLEEIVKHYQLNNIHEIWPNFKVYVHGGVYMDPFKERLKKVCGEPVILLDTYLASEGYFGYQISPKRKGMKLLLNNSIFFEFIPFNAEYFTESGELKDKHLAYTISEVKPNIDYALVISTNAGLWRYMLGDLVRFVDTSTQEIIISGRIKQYLSICGEHLSLDNINQAMVKVSTKHGFSFSEYTIYADEDNNQHCWFIGCDDGNASADLISEIDEELQKVNDDYAYVRKHSMPTPSLKVIPTQVFYDYLESINKLGAQNKIPRVMNKKQAEQWNLFLKTNGFL